LRVKFIVEDRGGYLYRPWRLIDDMRVTSLELAKEEVLREIAQYNKRELRERKDKASFRNLIRIIDQRAAEQCPQFLDYRDMLRQEFQGYCPECGYKFVDFLKGRELNQKENFRYCLGFGESDFERKARRVICFECPKCFVKSYFHCPNNWFNFYADWIVKSSEIINKKEASDEEE